MDSTARIRRLRWMCRRGMKELDVLLERFITSHEAELRAGQWPEFESFLQSEDDLVWDCLRGEIGAQTKPFTNLAAAIRGDASAHN